MSDHDHDRRLAEAFDGQAPRFENAPVQSDPTALKHLVEIAELPRDCRVLDAGCGPGLVSEALLQHGCRVFGVDLSREMIERARARCTRFSDRAEFHQCSLFSSEIDALAPFDAAISRYVLHHVVEPLSFINRQVDLLIDGGVMVLCDHQTDPHAENAQWHERLERARDSTHTSNLTGGQIIDHFARAGLNELSLTEESFTLDFDEWFDRGTPTEPKEAVRARLLEGPAIRGFTPHLRAAGAIRIDCVRVIVRGVKGRGRPAQC